MFKKRSIIIYFFIISIFMGMGILKVEAENNSKDIIMKVEYGIENKYKYGYSTPIKVEINNKTNDDINGQIEIRFQVNGRNIYDAFTSSINVKSKDSSQVIIPITVDEGNMRITAVLTENGKEIKKQNVYLTNGRINDLSAFKGFLTDDSNSESLKEIDFYTVINGELNNAKNFNVDLHKDILNNGSENIAALDVIVINNYNISQLSDEQYNSIINWVSDGGILIIGTGENSSKTVQNQRFNLSCEGTKNVVNGYTLADLRLKDYKLELGNSEEPLIYKTNYYKGYIYAATFDLNSSIIADSEQVRNFWQVNISKNISQKLSNVQDRDYNNYQMGNILKSIPLNSNLSTKPVIAFFVIYCAFVGIIIYFVMKKFKKLEMLWFVIPVSAIAASLILFVMGSNTRMKDITLNQFNIIINDGKEESIVKGYAGIVMKQKGKLKIEQPENTIMNYMEEKLYYGYSENTKEELKKLRMKKFFGKDNIYYEFQEVSPLEVKIFTIDGYKQIVPLIENNLKYDSGNIIGNIKNTQNYDIEKLVVVSSNYIWDLGVLKSGETKDINSKNISNNTLIDYVEKLSADYYDNYCNSKDKKNKEKYKNVERYMDIFRILSNNNYEEESSYLIAVTKMPVNYGFSFEEKNTSTYNTSVILQNVNIDYTDKDGYLKYPLGYFKPIIIEQSENGFIDTEYNEINGEGRFLVQYNVESLSQIEELCIGNLNSNYESNGISEIYIYNYNTNEYDNIIIKSANVKLSNPQDYVKDNIISIKVELKEEGNTQVPQISVKGRA